MFGTLILTAFLVEKGGRSLLRSKLSLISDNQGNIFALLNQKTKHMPTAAFLMQLMLDLHRAGVQLAPSHAKRDLNQWADELTHPSPTGFCPDRQLDTERIINRFSLLWELLSPIQPPAPKRARTE